MASFGLACLILLVASPWRRVVNFIVEYTLLFAFIALACLISLFEPGAFDDDNAPGSY